MGMSNSNAMPVLDPISPKEGSTSHCPTAALERIAEKCNTSVSSLARLTVKPAAVELQKSIMAYATHSDEVVPLLVQELIEDNDEREELMRVMKQFVDHEGPSPMGGLKQKQAPRPKIELGTSECCLTWPPPRFVAERQQMGVQISDETFAVHLVHYMVGDPVATFQCLKMWKEIEIVCTEKEKLLRFVRGVLQWHHEQKQRDTTGKSFALHRFKVSRDEIGWWEGEGLKEARKAESVILPKGQIEDILGDVQHFISIESRKWYSDHGLPHRRSYLFYGPPGTGKTSTIRVIATRFGLNCCYLSMLDQKFSNQLLGDALSNVPANAIIVLEDVDALFKERKSEQQISLTFSGLLNALDGLLSANGVIMVMTTNHIERLDEALIRGGRVDRRFLFEHPADEQIKALFESYYPGCADEVAVEFVKKVRAREEKEAKAISTLQQLFIEMRGKGERECVLEVDRFFEKHFPKMSQANVAAESEAVANGSL